MIEVGDIALEWSEGRRCPLCHGQNGKWAIERDAERDGYWVAFFACPEHSRSYAIRFDDVLPLSEAPLEERQRLSVDLGRLSAALEPHECAMVTLERDAWRVDKRPTVRG